MKHRKTKGKLEWEYESFEYEEHTPWGHVKAWNQPSTATWEARAYDQLGDEVASSHGHLSMIDALNALMADLDESLWSPPSGLGL